MQYKTKREQARDLLRELAWNYFHIGPHLKVGELVLHQPPEKREILTHLKAEDISRDRIPWR